MSRIIDVYNKVVSENRATGNVLKVAIHDGKFHLDEIMALCLLDSVGIAFEVVRTRKPHVMDSCDLIFDVSGSNAGRTFDHHQRGFDQTHGNGVTYATCGLVWDDLKDVILDFQCRGLSENSRNAICEKIEQRLIIPTDAVDTGVTGSLNPLTLPTMADIVGAYNSQDPSFQDASFDLCYKCIQQIIVHMIGGWILAAAEQERILQKMWEQQDSSMLILEQAGPWVELAVRYWEATSHFQVAVYPDMTHLDQWRIQSFPGDPKDTFQQRCSAPAHWKGLREGKFTDGPCPDKMIFAHPGGFIGGVRGTREDAVAVAEYWIANHS